MKITFLVPPVLIGRRPTERVAGCTYTLYPVPNIYELTVAATLEKNGFDVAYVESVLDKWNQIDFIEYLKKDDSDIYFIWTVNLGMKNDLKACSMIRLFKKEIPIIFMGPGPTYFISDFIIDKNTYVIRGEPEYTALELIKTLNNNGDISKIKGLSFKINGKVIHTHPRELIANLDDLPFPARHLLNIDKYFNPKLVLTPYTAVFTARNCPYRCIYCVPSSLSFARELEYKRFNNEKKPSVRMRSVKNVAEELYLLKKQGYKTISFQDDTFILDERRAIEICEILRKTGFIWGCQARADKITPELAKSMASSQCKYVDLGIESFDQRILDYIKKDLRVEDNIRGIKILKENNISAKINILLGCCNLETSETLNYTRKMIKKLHVDQVMFSIPSPFPGTEFYRIAKENNWLISGEYEPIDVQKKSIISYPHLSAKELEKRIFFYNLEFFLSFRFIIKNIIRFGSFKDFFMSLKALYRKLFA